jgi:hypothetical protein
LFLILGRLYLSVNGSLVSFSYILASNQTIPSKKGIFPEKIYITWESIVIDKKTYKKIQKVCEEEGLTVDLSGIPSLGDYCEGQEAELESDFISSLVRSNKQRGALIWCGFDYEDPSDENYLDLLKRLVKISCGDVSMKSAKSAIDEEGNETVKCKINGNKYEWTGNTWDEYIDPDVFQSMIDALNKETDGRYCVGSFDDEEIPVLFCTPRASESVGRLWNREDRSEAGERDIAFDVEMLPDYEKVCFRVLQLYSQSKSLATYCIDREIKESKLVEDALESLEQKGARFLEDARKLVENGTDVYSARQIKKLLDKKTAAAFNPDREYSESGLIFTCEMTAAQIESVIERLSSMKF